MVVPSNYNTLEYKRVHQPWALSEDQKPAAYAALFDCDWKEPLLKDPRVRQTMSMDGGIFGQLIKDCERDVLALDRAVCEFSNPASSKSGIFMARRTP